MPGINQSRTDDLLEQIRDLLQTQVAMSGEKNNVIAVSYNGGAGTPVVFTVGYAGNYSLTFRCYNSVTGLPVNAYISGKTSAGFTIHPDIDCYCDYITMPIF